MEPVLDQYLAMVPMRSFNWPKDICFDDWQINLIEKVINHPVSQKYPPSVPHKMSFLKHVMKQVEAGGSLVVGEVYECYAELVAIPESSANEFCFKSYHLLDCGYVHMKESTRLLSQGTTGLVTWKASFYFIEWIVQHKHVVNGKKILELGSGLGLTGIALCWLGRPLSYLFTDYHKDVLELLAQNVEMNLHGELECEVTTTSISKLDWSLQSSVDELLSSSHGEVDCIVATEDSQCAAMSGWQIKIKDFQGHTRTIQVDSPQRTTIRRLKDLVHQSDPDIPPFEQRLVHEKQELEDDCLLSSYADINDGSVIFLVRLIPFQVFVKGMDGSSHTIRIPSRSPQTYSVAHFKKLLQEKCGIRPEEQRLQYAGKELVDRMSLGDYNIINGSTLHLVARLRGGLALLTRSSHSCIMTGKTGGVLLMPCGHAVSTAALYSYCIAEIRKNKTNICCPCCSTEWSMKTLRQYTDLSGSQLSEVEEGLTRNFCLLDLAGVVKCDSCGGVWSSSSSCGSTCPSCILKKGTSDAETVKLLAECALKTIGHASCPCIRACPCCGKLIEHIEACKRVDCNGCNTTFCFNCLMIRTQSCQSYYSCPDGCSTAPRQTIIPKHVVYDIELVELFVSTLCRIFRKNKHSSAYVASTVRNTTTYQHFCSHLSSANLKWEIMDKVSKFNIFYYHDIEQYETVEILKIVPKFDDEN